jgi:MFS family permease
LSRLTLSFSSRCQIFFIIAAMCSSFSSLCIFLNIESFFYKITYLSIALSFRTFLSSIFGYFSPNILDKIGVKKSLILSQIFSLILLILLMLGFYIHNLFLVLTTTILTGLSFTLLNIVVTICFRLDIEATKYFRKNSARRELSFGLSRLTGCLLVPVLLYKINIYNIIIMIAIGHLFVIFLILGTTFPEKKRTLIKSNKFSFISIRKNITKLKFIFQLTAGLLLIALIPLLASSSNIPLTHQFSIVTRQLLWSVEAITMIMGGIIYLLSKKLYSNKILSIILLFNSFLLFLPIFSNNLVIIFTMCGLISFLLMLVFYIFRDNYILLAGNDPVKIKEHTSFAFALKDFICALSPLYLTCFLTKFSWLNFSMLIIATQLFLVGFSFFIGIKNINHVNSKNNVIPPYNSAKHNIV